MQNDGAAKAALAVAGRHRVIERLLHARRNGRLGHTLLLVGSGGHGTYEVATLLAQELLCDAGCSGHQQPGTTLNAHDDRLCPACRAVARFSHPDFLMVAPLSPEYRRQVSEGKVSPPDPITVALADDLYAPLEIGANWSVTVDQARDLIQWAALTPWQARSKVVVLAESDRIREESADILLKTLEEPPEDVTIILVTARPQDLLPTVRSRSHWVRVPPLGQDDVITLLVERGVAQDRARAVALVAKGDLWQARSLLGDGTSRLRRAAADLIRATLDPKRITAEVMGDVRRVLEGASAGEVSEIVRWTTWWLRDVLVALTAVEPPTEEVQSLLPSARKLGHVRLMAWLEEADRSYEMLTRNVTPSAVLAALIVYPRDERRLGAITTFPPYSPAIA